MPQGCRIVACIVSAPHTPPPNSTRSYGHDCPSHAPVVVPEALALLVACPKTRGGCYSPGPLSGVTGPRPIPLGEGEGGCRRTRGEQLNGHRSPLTGTGPATQAPGLTHPLSPSVSPGPSHTKGVWGGCASPGRLHPKWAWGRAGHPPLVTHFCARQESNAGMYQRREGEEGLWRGGGGGESPSSHGLRPKEPEDNFINKCRGIYCLRQCTSKRD